ncbi:ATP-binding protein [Ramlibacter monticola]|uniref:ATP-binding protein n=1 Tax=Ramlibacter monticola TaxID=1926872 RepID=A0A936Z2E2_9BURK|nr:ATP-binding protein [Ramlibacter monticola]MBL0392332.1 ATP-binding protein [Ramlibacter monticola]
MTAAARHAPHPARTRAPRAAPMPATSASVPWTDVLVAEVDRRIAEQVGRWRGEQAAPTALKSLVITDAEVDELMARASEPPEPALPCGSLAAQVIDAGAPRVLALQAAFELSPFELDAVLLCLASELDCRFDRLWAYLNDDLTRTRPSADLLLRLLAPPHERVFLQGQLASDAPLLQCALLLADDSSRRGGNPLYRVADGVLRHLLERGGVDAAIADAVWDDDVAPLAPTLWRARPQVQEVHALLAAQEGASTPLLVNLHGRDGSGRAFVAHAACGRLQRRCLSLDGRKLKRGADSRAAWLAALRDARLGGDLLFVHHADAGFDDAERRHEWRTLLQSWLRRFGGTVLLASAEALPLAAWFPAADVAHVALPNLDMGEREAAWRGVLAAVCPLPEGARESLAHSLAAKFRLTEGEIAVAAQQARTAARGMADEAGWTAVLHEVVARVAAPRLHELAEAVPVRHSLADIVLPPDRLEVLKDLVRRTQHRRTVLEDWRFDDVSARGRGLVALFHGASGTGKTMAAEGIASTLRMRLFRIDLAGVVSKYIGETEKNLRTIFDEADRADAVLFFDEADALFGKRSEVKDAHDRYANIEINYLLQRIELFDGIAILATNKHSHMDEAFMRRIHVSLEFPLPRPPERLRLWDRSFPRVAPMAGDIDWDFLAQRFELSGGAIRNAALGAAYLAAEGGDAIGMKHVVNALRTELVKAGRRMQDGEFAPHAHLLTQPAAAARTHAGAPSPRRPGRPEE